MKEMKYKETDDTFRYTVCEKNFKTKAGLSKHANQTHSSNMLYECAKCGLKYKTKFALKRHIETNYLSLYPFKCTTCKASFRLSRQLSLHMRKDHPNLRSQKCSQCFSTFKTKNDLQRHIDRIHTAQNNQKLRRPIKGLICILCGEPFARKSMILFHLEKEHNVQMNFETHHFNDIEQFYKWKDEVEKTTICRFIKMRCDKIKKSTIFSFVCHRSGNYTPHAKKNLRRLKMQGSKKLNGFCPAELSLRQDNENGTCVLNYLNTHVGHRTADEAELAHVYLNKEEKRKVAEKIADGTSFDEILNDLGSNSETNKLHLLDTHDLHNIAASYNLKGRRIKKTAKCTIKSIDVDKNPEIINKIHSFQDIDEFIFKYSNSVLYYKKENETDETFPFLESKDLVIIIMSETQRNMLQKFGSNVIAVGGTYKDENCNFFIQSLLVIDNYFEAFVCAFAISNRQDDDIIDIFLFCVRENVVGLYPNFLITDTRDTYYRTWLQLISVPQHWFHCSWHVKQMWKEKLKYISNKEKRRLIRKKLDELSREPNEHEFIRKLNKFCSTDDENTEHFFEYFRQNYVKNLHLWATCYRCSVDSNANIYMESFYNIFKNLHIKSRKIENFCDALVIFEKYLLFEERLLKIKEIRGCLSNKLRLLRRRHDYVLKNSENMNYSIENNDAGEWVLYSHSSADDQNVIELFIIQCINKDQCPVFENCKLVCEKCEVCAHQYKCSCIDSTLKNNMCQHVHAVCLHMKTLTDSSSESSTLEKKSADTESNQIVLVNIESSPDDFPIEVLNSPPVLVGDVAVTKITDLPMSMNNEFDSDNLDDLVEMPFCDVVTLDNERVRLKEAIISTAEVVDMASTEAALYY